jgi:hypothetical protein
MNLDQWWPRVEDLARRLVAAARGDRTRAWQPGPHWQRRKLNFAIQKSQSSRPSGDRTFCYAPLPEWPRHCSKLSTRRNRLPASYGSGAYQCTTLALFTLVESPVKMISMRRIWAQRPNLVSNSRPDPIIGASRMGRLLVRLAIARSPSCVRQDPFSRPTNWQFFGNARSRNWLPLQ